MTRNPGCYQEILAALADKESCRTAGNWSSISDLIRHHPPQNEPITHYQVAAITKKLVHDGLVRRTETMGEIRYRLTDAGRKALASS